MRLHFGLLLHVGKAHEVWLTEAILMEMENILSRFNRSLDLYELRSELGY